MSDESQHPSPNKPKVLAYRDPHSEFTPPISRGWQASAGVMSWVCVLAMCFRIATATGSIGGVLVMIGLGLGLSLLGGHLLHERCGWTAFVPALVVSASLTCLVPPIGLLILCGFHR